jgi:hypothetical protein
MALYTIQPQRLVDWLAAGNTLPTFLAGSLQRYLAALPTPIAADVSVARDGTVTFDADAAEADLIAALDDLTPADLDPGRAREDQYTGIMGLLDAFADAIDAGQTPTAAQTQATVARLVRVVQYLAQRR